jgi:hypothetical protein
MICMLDAVPSSNKEGKEVAAGALWSFNQKREQGKIFL